MTHICVRQTDNASLFYMANKKTQRSSKSADHGSVIICLLSCNSSDTQRKDATLENKQWQKIQIFIDSKLMLQEKGNNNKDQIYTEHPIHRTFTRHVAYVKTIRIKFLNQYQEGIF